MVVRFRTCVSVLSLQKFCLRLPKIIYLLVSHVKPLVYINLKFEGHAEACQLHTEQVVGWLRV